MGGRLLETIGIIGSLILIISNLPQLHLFVKQGHAEGISAASNWWYLFGLTCRTIYLFQTMPTVNLIILGPYVFAYISLGVTFYYCYFPKLNTGLKDEV